ncbi:MAG: hypothetical protein MUF77_09965 [Leptospira sp.]|jgi:hypothetical protein|nr:hypothetical protein [Leptospira sp.]
MDQIKHILFRPIISHFRGFNRYSKFILIGNQIDGFLKFDKEVFNSYEDVKEWLPQIIHELEAGGEWALELYQVPDSFRIWRKYGYYEVPSRGRRVFNLSYMNFGRLGRCFAGSSILHFESRTIEKDSYTQKETILYQFEKNYTIHLHEKEDRFTFDIKDYPGDIERLEKERLYQRKNYSSAREYTVDSHRS